MEQQLLEIIAYYLIVRIIDRHRRHSFFHNRSLKIWKPGEIRHHKTPPPPTLPSPPHENDAGAKWSSLINAASQRGSRMHIWQRSF